MCSIWEEAAWQEWPAWHAEEGPKSYSEVLAVTVLPGSEKKFNKKPNTIPTQNPEPALLLVPSFFWTIVPCQTEMSQV